MGRRSFQVTYDGFAGRNAINQYIAVLIRKDLTSRPPSYARTPTARSAAAAPLRSIHPHSLAGLRRYQVITIRWLTACRGPWRPTGNPAGCPRGFYGDTTRECRSTGAIIQRYPGKISGPLLDHIALHMEVPARSWAAVGQRRDVRKRIAECL